MDTMYTIKYLPDADVTKALDVKLRELLSTCFTNKESSMFKTQRYFKEMPAHRWLVYAEDGELVAHIAVHDKVVKTQSRSFRIGGVADVCVHPNHRRKGLVKQILQKIFIFLNKADVSVSVLFSEGKRYASSGYRPVSNLFSRSEAKEWTQAEGAYVKEIKAHSWPKEDVFLEGLTF
jgi:predicted N-acetyltransferase YhbS